MFHFHLPVPVYVITQDYDKILRYDTRHGYIQYNTVASTPGVASVRSINIIKLLSMLPIIFN